MVVNLGSLVPHLDVIDVGRRVVFNPPTDVVQFIDLLEDIPDLRIVDINGYRIRRIDTLPLLEQGDLYLSIEIVIQHEVEGIDEILQIKDKRSLVLIGYGSPGSRGSHLYKVVALQLVYHPGLEVKVNEGIPRRVVFPRLRLPHRQDEPLPPENQLHRLEYAVLGDTELRDDITVNAHLRTDGTVAHRRKVHCCLMERRVIRKIYLLYLGDHDAAGRLKSHRLGFVTLIWNSTITISWSWFLRSLQKSVASDIGCGYPTILCRL